MITFFMFPRTVKSFVRRQRRLSGRQQDAFDRAWPLYGVAPESLCDFQKLFQREAPVVCEIGFGDGDTLLPMAVMHPEWNYVGIEIHEPGVANLFSSMLAQDIRNIRVIIEDAVTVFEKNIPDHSLSRIHIFFPDPWPKKKHRKRRLISDNVAALLVKKLKPGGVIHSATDWEDYAMQMMRVLSANPQLKNACGEDQFADNQVMRLRDTSKFEKRGVKLGRGVWDLVFIRSLLVASM